MEVLYLYIAFSYLAMVGFILHYLDDKRWDNITIIILLLLYVISPITFAILCGARLEE